VKRLLDGVVMPKISAGSTPVVIDLATENSQDQSSNDMITSSTLQVPGGQQTDEVSRTFILSIVLIRLCDCCIRIGSQLVQTTNFSIRRCTGDILA
jgi:hypothetical protein